MFFPFYFSAVAMARPRRHASENVRSGCRSVSQSVSSSAEAGMEEAGAEEDEGPIFSLSKSSADVLMATGPPHARDPAWTRLDLRRSSSANTHSEQNSLALQQLHAHMWQHIDTANSHQRTLTHTHSPNTLGERWMANVDRWSGSSGGAYSRSSTPETVIWTGGTSRPWSPSPATSPFISPVGSPTSPAPEPFRPLPITTCTRQRGDFVMSSSTASPPQSAVYSPSSPSLLQVTKTKDEGVLKNHMSSFPFPFPIRSSLTLEDGGVASQLGCLVNGTTEKPPSMTFSPGGTKSLGCDAGRPADGQTFCHLSPDPAAEGQEEKMRRQEGRVSVCYLELPLRPRPSSPTGSTPGWRSPLISSLSESHLDDCCRCKSKHSSGHDIGNVKVSAGALKGEVLREEGTMTSHSELADVAVQTASPVGSWWNLRKNMSYNSSMGSHSILGSPPGSRLNLMVSLGSKSNLVSPSSSMFQVESDEEEDQWDNLTWDSPPSDALDRRRSCLKRQGDERHWHAEQGRRSSMKQVQWDEEGMTWDVHGADLDPEELSKAIRKHLEIKSSKDRETPRPSRRNSKKKKKVEKENVAKPNPPVMVDMWTSMAESEGRPEEEGEKTLGEEGGKKEEAEEATCGNNNTQKDNVKYDKEEEGGREEEDSSHHKSPSGGSGHSRKKSAMRSLRRPGWCGGSKNVND